ncbi:kinase-like domain-containing protein, partial [Thamnocephalis sphaerospora]
FESHFTVERTLGSGEFSEAFAARFKDDKRLYAVKRTKFPYAGLRDRQRQLNEVEILWRIGQHPHCICLVDAWEQMGHLYLQMELCSGGSLKEHMDAQCANDKLAETEIWDMFADMVAGLKHIHDLGILHLDLKPANVLLDDNGRLRIGDFGLAVMEPLSRDIEREGDREYIAPEILDGKYGRPADVFSLGLIVLEMAANVVLPDNGLPWRKLRNGDLSDCDFTGTSTLLVTCIRHMLNPVPSKRPTVTDLTDKLQKACSV